MIYSRHRAFLAATIGLALAAPLAAAAPVKKATTPAKSAATAASTEIKPAADGSVTRAQIIAQTKQIFARADTNHDGYMSRAEFGARMAVVLNHAPDQLGTQPTKEQAQQMLDAANNAFNAVDTNHDGKLSLTEAEARPLAAFDAQDTNHDGVLTLAEKQAAHDAQARQAEGPMGPPVVTPSGPGR